MVSYGAESLSIYHWVYYEYHYTLLTVAIFYLPVIFFIKWIMTDKTPFKSAFCNRLLGLWNSFLCIGSGIGAYYLLPFVYNDIRENGLVTSICSGRYIYNDLATHIVILHPRAN